jgi:hypothetical protein
MTNTTALVSQPTGALDIGNPSAFLFDLPRMQALMSFAEMMSKAVVTVPKHLHGKPADCMAITLQAMRWQMDPFIVASKTHVVNGNLGYEAQLVVAVLKNSGAVKGRPHYEFQGEGPSLQCRAGFIPAGESEIVWTEWLSSSKITVKNSPLWKTNEKQQFGYLQARNWARLYAPDALLGIYTDDELDGDPPTARYMGPVDEVPPPAKPALPEYEDSRFDENLPAWAKLVAGGKKTAPELLAMLSTKTTFSEMQKAKILSLKIEQPEPVHDAAKPPADQWVADFQAGEEEQA